MYHPSQDQYNNNQQQQSLNEAQREGLSEQLGKLSLGQFKQEKFISEGAYGAVYKGVNLLNNSYVAMKRMNQEIPNEGISSCTMREIYCLKKLKNEPNIVNFLDYIITSKEDPVSGEKQQCTWLIFDFCQCDLSHVFKLQQNQKMAQKLINQQETNLEIEYLPKQIIQKFIFSILNAIKSCHKKRIFHRDIKPQNILLQHKNNIQLQEGENVLDNLEQFELKLADFGLARSYSIPQKPYTNEVVTLWYRAPELLLQQNEYSIGVDIWSAGCIFAEMCTKSQQALFDGENHIDMIRRIFSVLGTPDESTWPGVSKLEGMKAKFKISSPQPLSNFVHKNLIGEYGLDLLEKMLTLDPLQRIDAVNALNHPYFSDMQVQQIQ